MVVFEVTIEGETAGMIIAEAIPASDATGREKACSELLQKILLRLKESLEQQGTN